MTSLDGPGARRWLPALALLVLSLTWGYTWVVAKQGLAYAPPLAFAAQRCLGGSLALFVALVLLRRPLRPAAPAATLAIGLTQGTAFVLCQNWALMAAGPGKTAVLIYTMPIWTLVLAWPILGERVRGTQWLAAAGALTGLLLIIEPWNLHAGLLGNALGLAAALFWAIGTILVKRLRARQRVDLLGLIAWQMLAATVPLVVLMWLVPEPATRWTADYAWILVAMSIVSTALCWFLWTYILDRVPAWEASLSVLGTPVVAIVSSRLVMGEQFSASEIAGMALIGGGLALLSFLGWLASRRNAI
jgi:drug/metabolite transporter (DMT)-like permease